MYPVECTSATRVKRGGLPTHREIACCQPPISRFEHGCGSERELVLARPGSDLHRRGRPSHQAYQGTAFELVDHAVDFVLGKIALSVGTPGRERAGDGGLRDTEGRRDGGARQRRGAPGLHERRQRSGHAVRRPTTQERRATTQETAQESHATTQERILLRTETTVNGRLIAKPVGVTQDGVKYHWTRFLGGRAAGRVRHLAPPRAGAGRCRNERGRWVDWLGREGTSSPRSWLASWPLSESP